MIISSIEFFFFFQAEDGIRDPLVTGVQTCALPIWADCVDAGGRPCPAPREAAFATFYAHLPQVGVAVVLSVLIALFIRLLAPLWRPSTIGFAASVVGAGVTTVVFTVLNGSG